MKRSIIIVFIIILLTFLTVFIYHFSQQADINYYQGHRLFLKGNYEQAIPFYVKALEEGSSRRETYEELAYCYLWTRKSEKSIQLFKNISTQNPDDYKVKGSLAEAYSWNRNYAEAINIFREIIIKTNSPWAKVKLAEVYLWDAQPEKAKIILESLVKKDPDNYNIKLLWGKGLYYTGESEKASKIFEELLKEKNEEVTRLLAETYLASGQHEKAIKFYREAIEKEPFNVKARISFAELLSWTKQYEDSIAEYKKVLEIDPENIEALKKMAEVYYWKGDLDNSELTYREILRINPDEKETYASIGEILTWQKKYSEATDYFSRSLKEGKNVKEKILYGRALLYSGQHEPAEDVFIEVLEESPDNLEAKTYLADTYSYSKRFKKGIEIYQQILEEKDDIEIKEKLADVLSWDKQYEKAFELYDEILEEKYDEKIHLQKARVLGWARRYGEADEEYQKILDKKYNEVIELEMQAKKAYWSGRVKTAIAKYNELIVKEPENVEAMFDLSQVYSYQSMWEDAISEYNRILAVNPTHFRAREGVEKTELISKHVSLETDYRYFEADSPSRDADIRKHEFLSNLKIPLNFKTFIDIGYTLAERYFTDFHDILENHGKVKVTYLERPDWQISGYYGLIGYNKDIDELTHLFGGDFGYRITDYVVYSFFYDRERLENNSTVIREHYHRDKFKNRIDLDVTRRLKLGLDHTYAYYSDDNSLNEPGFDILYYLSLEPKRLTFKYRYFYKEFNDKVGEYFSPKGFSTSVFTINWRHFLNKEEIFFGANDIYYDLKYDLSIDSTGIAGHKLSWIVYYDITKRLNLNVGGSIMGSSTGVYEESEVKAGIKYYF